jgi:hypothetical protein
VRLINSTEAPNNACIRHLTQNSLSYMRDTLNHRPQVLYDPQPSTPGPKSETAPPTQGGSIPELE